jgi:hypothetical protein
MSHIAVAARAASIFIILLFLQPFKPSLDIASRFANRSRTGNPVSIWLFHFRFEKGDSPDKESAEMNCWPPAPQADA